MIRLLVITGLLIYCSIWDIRTGMLPVVPLLILAVPGFLWRIVSGSTFWWIFFSSVFPAAVLYLISAVSKGFGRGDVLMIFAAGIWEGFETLFPAMLYAFVLAGCMGILIALPERIAAAPASLCSFFCGGNLSAASFKLT